MLRATATAILLITAVAMTSAHLGIAEVTGGFLLVLLSAVWVASLARRVSIEVDPGRQLGLDLLIVLSVALGLAGVGVMGMAIPG